MQNIGVYRIPQGELDYLCNQSIFGHLDRFISDDRFLATKPGAINIRPVVPGSAGGAMAPPDFGRSVNPISTKGGRL